LIVGVFLLAGCSFPGTVKPTVKIGLSAPFEGLYRDLGYEVLHAVRLAVRQRNDAGGVGGCRLVEFVALNDFNEVETAIVQAHKMAIDPDILGVLGGWTPEVAQATRPEYGWLGVAFLSPQVDFTQAQPVLDREPPFAAGSRQLSGGVSPGPAAVWAYGEANRLLDAASEAGCARGQLTRESVQRALAE